MLLTTKEEGHLMTVASVLLYLLSIQLFALALHVAHGINKGIDDE